MIHFFSGEGEVDFTSCASGGLDGDSSRFWVKHTLNMGFLRSLENNDALLRLG